MNARTTMKVATISIALFSATLSVAATNPLDPNFYADKFGRNLPPIQSANTTPYRDLNNPLQPSYGQTDFDQWTPTRIKSGPGYVDRNNPLHPSFKR
jgi:hypothetical protein